MSILRKSVDTITLEDINALIEAETRESSELEFKGTLPFVRQSGQPQTVDRWIEHGDRVGTYARDQLLAELVAFANADGGTLVLGVHETDDEPRRAASLEALPNAEGLARRLYDASEDVIEPRLPNIVMRALPVGEDGSGYVVMRVGKSLAAPHRLTSTREFYIRRGERSVRMNVREIRDITLDLARTGDRIEQAFAQRQSDAATMFHRMLGSPGSGPGAVLVRVSALPIGSQAISNITARRDLWWLGSGFNAQVGEGTYPCGYPARDFNEAPNIRLRSLVTQSPPEQGGCDRTVRGDGLVEFTFHHPRFDHGPGESTYHRVYVSWILCTLIGALAQVHKLRTALAWDGVEYGLEAQIFGETPLHLNWQDRGIGGRGSDIKASLPLLLPRYSVPFSDDYDQVVRLVINDLFDATGRSLREQISIPWATIL